VRKTPPEVRFWRRVDKTDACWLWTGGTNGKYGVFSAETRHRSGKKVYAHRFSYELSNGPIPEGLVINHLCEVKLCVRPDHLEAATRSRNARYGDHPSARLARQTHCKWGHKFTEANTYIKSNGCRACRKCRTRRANERYWRHRESPRRLRASIFRRFDQ